MLTLFLSLALLVAPPSKQTILLVEKNFYASLKQVDKEQHRNLTGQFKKIFARQRSSPYQLYQEFQQIDQKSKREAQQQAKATGMKEREYVRFIGDIQSNYVAALMNQYGMSIDLRNAFRNNYCSCYSENGASMCAGGTCILGGNL